MRQAYWRRVEAMSPEERGQMFPHVLYEEHGAIYAVAKHTLEYIKLRTSFNGSKEWREFSRTLRTERGFCARCGQVKDDAHPLQTSHGHELGETVDSTFIQHGFLYALKPENFEVLCALCHIKDHPGVVLSDLVGTGQYKRAREVAVNLGVVPYAKLVERLIRRREHNIEQRGGSPRS